MPFSDDKLYRICSLAYGIFKEQYFYDSNFYNNAVEFPKNRSAF